MSEQSPRELAAKAVLSTLNGLIPGAADGPTTVEVTHERTAHGRPSRDGWSSDAHGFAERLALVLDVSVLRPLLSRIAELETLATTATEWRLSSGSYRLYVRRAVGVEGFAVIEARARALRGRRAWTPDGWTFTALLTDAELFCWPDGQAAVAEARKLLAADSTPDGITRQIAPTQVLEGQADTEGDDG